MVLTLITVNLLSFSTKLNSNFEFKRIEQDVAAALFQHKTGT